MWKSESDCVCVVLVAILAIATLVSAAQESGHKNRECDPTNLDEMCMEDGEACAPDKITKKFSCICKRDYERDIASDKCIKRPTTLPPLPETTTEKLGDTSHSSGSSVAVGLLVPIFLVGLGILGFCVARRYRLLPCRRNLYGNVLVTRDDDDDDPPIA